MFCDLLVWSSLLRELYKFEEEHGCLLRFGTAILEPDMSRRVNVVHVCVEGGGHGIAFLFFHRRTSRHPYLATKGHFWEAGVFRVELDRGLTTLCCLRAAHGQCRCGRWPAGARGPGHDV